MNRIILNRKFWIVPIAIWSLVVLGSVVWNLAQLEVHARQLAVNRAQFAFKMVESFRLWNARHGGVYAVVGPQTQPNPYLTVPERDITTSAGTNLTLVNPAFMTRQLTGVVRELSGLVLHITSLNPLNPGNVPDEWERRALESFEEGGAERGEFVASGGAVVFRYMAPLRTVKECLRCHGKQGYRIGDIRGGISISYPAASLLASSLAQRRQLVLTHFTVWLLLAGLTLYALARSRDQMLSLRKAKEEQDGLVDRRTMELREEVRERQQAEAQLRLFIESSGEGICAVDTEGRCSLINPQGLHLLGLTDRGEIIGRTLHDLIHRCGDEDCRLEAAYRGGQAVHAEDDRFWRADGSAFPVEYRCDPIWDGTELIGAVITFADISERQAVQRDVWRRANYDLLTGLVNRNLFMDRLQQGINCAQNSRSRFALMFIDLDRFKEVNDKLGHDAGDQVLQEAARRVRAAVRKSDTVGRIGGDEFTVLLNEIVDAREAEVVAGKILETLAAPFRLKGRSINMSGSVGIALYPQHGRDAETLMKVADMSMYVAKREGRNAYRFYDCRGGGQ